MRRACIVLLVLLIAVSGCFAALNGVLLGVADDVTVTRQTLYGDPAAAEGLDILVRNHYEQNLMWETSLTLDASAALKTVFTFSNDRITIPSTRELSGVEFESLNSVFFDDEHMPESAREKYAAVIKVFTDNLNAVPEGERRTFTMDLAEYLEFYPLEGQILLPGYEIYFSEFDHWSELSAEVAQQINDFFRIPVDTAFTVEYTIDKTSSGSSYGASTNSGYGINASGVATEEACYFTFNTVMDDGTIADTSLIPGGYGIYRLPYEAGVGADFDSLEMVYALDPTERYDSMYLSDDGNRLRLHTWQGNDLMITVIDIATMTQIQKEKLVTASGDYHLDVISYDDFILIVKDRYYSERQDRITVWEQLADGSFSHAFTVGTSEEIFPEGSSLNLFNDYTNAVDYADGKLAVLQHQLYRQDTYMFDDYCDLYVAVYDATGLIYAGTCQWNLSQINLNNPFGERIKPMFDDSIEVSW